MAFADFLSAADVAIRDLAGGDVVYTPTVGAAVTVRGVFDAAYVKVDMQNAGVSSQGPAVWLNLSDLPAGAVSDRGAVVTVSGVAYKRHEAKLDGTGGVVLLLHRTT